MYIMKVKKGFYLKCKFQCKSSTVKIFCSIYIHFIYIYIYIYIFMLLINIFSDTEIKEKFSSAILAVSLIPVVRLILLAVITFSLL